LAARTTSRHALAAADIAGVDAQAGRARIGGFERALVVEMDVGDDRHRAARTISRSAAVDSSSGHDTRMMSAPASSQRRIWSIVAFGVAGQRVGHGLHRDRRVAADRHLADHDLAALAPR
jgi:hypothetical protein